METALSLLKGITFKEVTILPPYVTVEYQTHLVVSDDIIQIIEKMTGWEAVIRSGECI